MNSKRLDEIVEAYIRDRRRGARGEMDSFRGEPSRRAAIRRAALCVDEDGKRHPHQYRIPRPLLELAEERLQAVATRLANAPDFDSLHGIVKAEIGSVHGIGKLMVYDIAQRIGAYLRIFDKAAALATSGECRLQADEPEPASVRILSCMVQRPRKR